MAHTVAVPIVDTPIAEADTGAPGWELLPSVQPPLVPQPLPVPTVIITDRRAAIILIPRANNQRADGAVRDQLWRF